MDLFLTFLTPSHIMFKMICSLAVVKISYICDEIFGNKIENWDVLYGAGPRSGLNSLIFDGVISPAHPFVL